MNKSTNILYGKEETVDLDDRLIENKDDRMKATLGVYKEIGIAILIFSILASVITLYIF